jgi:hypothetical protein
MRAPPTAWRGRLCGDTDQRAPRSGGLRCLLQIKKTKKLSSPRAKGPALGEGPLFTESKTLTEGYFHQILSKNSKQI